MNFDSFSFFDGTSMVPVTQVSWADYWKGIIPDGVVSGVGDEMQVYADSTGMKVKVKTGACFVDNHRGVIESAKELTIAAAHTSKPRIDIVVARVVYGNENASYMELAVKTGTAATNPVAPAVTQTRSVYEVKLAEVYVGAAVVTITAENVTDCRNLFTAGRQAVGFVNADTVQLKKGMLVTLSDSLPDAVVRCSKGHIPIGVVQSDYIGIGARGQIETHPGNVAEITCGSKKVAIGDVLIQSETPGIARAGSGFAGGLALASKADNIIGNVRSLLTFFSKLPTQNKWYLPMDIQETDVICAFQFINALSEADALKSVNNSDVVYSLSKTGSVTWEESRGFYCYQMASGLVNADIADMWDSTKAAGIGYSLTSNPSPSASTTDANSKNECVGINMKQGKRVLSPFSYTYYGWRSKCCLIRTQELSESPNTNGIRYVDLPSLQGKLNGALTGNFINIKTYYNGAGQTMSTPDNDIREYECDVLFGIGNSRMASTGYITAVALYSTELSNDQHKELADNISALSGF